MKLQKFGEMGTSNQSNKSVLKIKSGGKKSSGLMTGTLNRLETINSNAHKFSGQLSYLKIHKVMPKKHLPT